MARLLKPKAFVVELLRIVPELIPTCQKHLRQHRGKLVPHVFMERVRDYVVKQLRAGLTDEQSPAARALRFFESALTSGACDVEEILVSFVENVAEFVPTLPALYDLMGPKLREELAFYNSSKAFVKELLETVPELIPIYQKHIQDNDALLAHVLMGRVSEYVIDQLRAGQTDEPSPASRTIRFFEHAMTVEDDDVQEIIHVSFVENVAEFVPELPILYDLMGPKLREVLVYYESWMKHIGPEPDTGLVAS
jgi:hypothetical protein